MQNFRNILIKTVIAVSVVLVTAGCIMEKTYPYNLQSVTVQLNVSSDFQTKATEDPTSAEKEIRTLRILAYYSGTLAGDYYRATASDAPIFMDLVMPQTGTYDVDFYVIANEAAIRLTADSPSFSSEMTASQLSSVKYDALALANGTPMYGMSTVSINVENILPTFNNIEGHYGHEILNYVVPVELSRPMAKLSLYVAKEPDNMADMIIKDVRMLAKGTRQYNYLLPKESSVLKGIPPRINDRDLLSSESFTITKTLASDAEKGVASNYDKLFSETYISEVPFGSTSWNVPVSADINSVVLAVDYSSGEGSVVKTGYIYLPVVERNTHYKILCSFSSDGDMSIEYEVVDWDDAQMWEGGLTFDYPTHSFLLPSATSSVAPTSPASMTYVPGESTGAFKGFFQMLYPENETWNPTLLDGMASDYTVEVWDHTGTNQITSPDDFISGNVWYMIKVIPLKPENSGKEVRLAITFQPRWSDQAEFLMINGSQSSLLWPYAGSSIVNDPNYVIITQE